MSPAKRHRCIENWITFCTEGNTGVNERSGIALSRQKLGMISLEERTHTSQVFWDCVERVWDKNAAVRVYSVTCRYVPNLRQKYF